MHYISDHSPFYKILLFSAALIWGSSFFMVKTATDVIPVNWLLAIRFLTAAVILAVVFRRSLLENLNWPCVLRGCLIGALLFAGYLLQTIGITYTTPGKNAFITAGYCVLVPFLYWAVARVKPDVYNVTAALLLVAGIGFLSLSDGFSVNLGDLLTMVCAVFYALQIVAVARFSRQHNVFALTVWQFVAAGALALVAALLFEPFPEVGIWTPSLVAQVAYLAIACSAVALLFQNVGQAHVHPATASVLLSLESVFGVVFSVIFYGEQMTVKLVVGFILIFVAIVVSETKLSFVPALHHGPSFTSGGQADNGLEARTLDDSPREGGF